MQYSRYFFSKSSDVALATSTLLRHFRAMLKHVQEVEITILSDVFGHAQSNQQRIVQHNFVVGTEELEHSRFDLEAPATILPTRAHFVCVVVDKQGNTFVSSDKMYTAKMHYSMRTIIPNDSVLYALIFEAHNCPRPVLGLFDASVVGGHCMSKYSCIQRHAILHKAFRSSSRCPHIRMHWVGHERVLVHDLQYKRVTVDFEIDCAVRLSDTIARDMQVYRLIPKEPLITLVPKLNPAKMNETLRTKRAKLMSTT